MINMRSIVIFYSHSGNTYTVAKEIKHALNSHFREIIDYTSNRSVFEYIFPTIFDSASIEPYKIDIDYYDTIIIGTPVWFGSLTPAIKKFIDNMDFKNKNIILFNTMKSKGGHLAMKRLVKHVQKHNGNIIATFT
ncbi:MAG: hypothetical protein E7Z84_05160, partial [Methanosphaera stadtmanae]|nr:hypothetical protein [Methanosphaera stadtmanae]